MFERQPKLFGSSFCPSLQLVGRVAGLLVKVNKNREPHPHRTCNAAQKKSTNWSIKCLLEPITPNICAQLPNWCYANAGPLQSMFPTPRNDNIEKSPILVQPVHHHGLPCWGSWPLPHPTTWWPNLLLNTVWKTICIARFPTKYIVFRVLQLIKVKSHSIAESRIREAASILV